jgi:hypothetical protein
MNKPTAPGEISDRDVTTAVESLKSASFKARTVRTDWNAADPAWKAPDGRPIIQFVRDKLTQFKNELDVIKIADLHGGAFYKFDVDTVLAVGRHQVFRQPVVPTAQDLFHVYGPDRDNTKDWRKYYRYAWKDKGPNGILYSTDVQIIQEGKLFCNAYAYSAQGSFALAGAGMFFLPEYGNARISIRPYVQWLTTASFTGTQAAPASVAAFVGIFVESWKLSGGGYLQEIDHFIPVWSMNSQSFTTGVTAGGAATVGDGLATEITAATNRKYAIYVYAYLEASAAPTDRNELRFCTIDIDATVPFVVVEEKLL